MDPHHSPTVDHFPSKPSSPLDAELEYASRTLARRYEHPRRDGLIDLSTKTTHKGADAILTAATLHRAGLTTLEKRQLAAKERAKQAKADAAALAKIRAEAAAEATKTLTTGISVAVAHASERNLRRPDPGSLKEAMMPRVRQLVAQGRVEVVDAETTGRHIFDRVSTHLRTDEALNEASSTFRGLVEKSRREGSRLGELENKLLELRSKLNLDSEQSRDPSKDIVAILKRLAAEDAKTAADEIEEELAKELGTDELLQQYLGPLAKGRAPPVPGMEEEAEAEEEEERQRRKREKDQGDDSEESSEEEDEDADERGEGDKKVGATSLESEGGKSKKKTGLPSWEMTRCPYSLARVRSVRVVDHAQKARRRFVRLCNKMFRKFDNEHATPPEAPFDVEYAGGAVSSVAVRWQPPVFDGGANIFDYHIRYTVVQRVRKSAATFSKISTKVGPASTTRFWKEFPVAHGGCVIENLPPESSVTDFQVCAVNSMGNSPWSTPIEGEVSTEAPHAPSPPIHFRVGGIDIEAVDAVLVPASDGVSTAEELRAKKKPKRVTSRILRQIRHGVIEPTGRPGELALAWSAPIWPGGNPLTRIVIMWEEREPDFAQVAATGDVDAFKTIAREVTIPWAEQHVLEDLKPGAVLYNLRIRAQTRTEEAAYLEEQRKVAAKRRVLDQANADGEDDDDIDDDNILSSVSAASGRVSRREALNKTLRGISARQTAEAARKMRLDESGWMESSESDLIPAVRIPTGSRADELAYELRRARERSEAVIDVLYNGFHQRIRRKRYIKILESDIREILEEEAQKAMEEAENEEDDEDEDEDGAEEDDLHGGRGSSKDGGVSLSDGATDTETMGSESNGTARPKSLRPKTPGLGGRSRINSGSTTGRSNSGVGLKFREEERRRRQQFHDRLRKLRQVLNDAMAELRALRSLRSSSRAKLLTIERRQRVLRAEQRVLKSYEGKEIDSAVMHGKAQRFDADVLRRLIDEEIALNAKNAAVAKREVVSGLQHEEDLETFVAKTQEQVKEREASLLQFEQLARRGRRRAQILTTLSNVGMIRVFRAWHSYVMRMRRARDKMRESVIRMLRGLLQEGMRIWKKRVRRMKRIEDRKRRRAAGEDVKRDGSEDDDSEDSDEERRGREAGGKGWALLERAQEKRQDIAIGAGDALRDIARIADVIHAADTTYNQRMIAASRKGDEYMPVVAKLATGFQGTVRAAASELSRAMEKKESEGGVRRTEEAEVASKAADEAVRASDASAASRALFGHEEFGRPGARRGLDEVSSKQLKRGGQHGLINGSAPAALVDDIIRQGHAYARQGNAEDAMSRLRRAEMIAGRAKDAPRLLKVYVALAPLYEAPEPAASCIPPLENARGIPPVFSRDDLAAVHYSRCHELAKELGDKMEEARALEGWGRSLRRMGLPAMAMAKWEQAMALREEIGDVRWLAPLYRAMASVLRTGIGLDDPEQENAEANLGDTGGAVGGRTAGADISWKSQFSSSSESHSVRQEQRIRRAAEYEARAARIEGESVAAILDGEKRLEDLANRVVGTGLGKGTLVALERAGPLVPLLKQEEKEIEEDAGKIEHMLSNLTEYVSNTRGQLVRIESQLERLRNGASSGAIMEGDSEQAAQRFADAEILRDQLEKKRSSLQTDIAEGEKITRAYQVRLTSCNDELIEVKEHLKGETSELAYRAAGRQSVRSGSLNSVNLVTNDVLGRATGGVGVLVLAVESTLMGFDLSTGRCTIAFQGDRPGAHPGALIGHASRITTTAYVGGRCYTGSMDCTVRVWDMERPRTISSRRQRTLDQRLAKAVLEARKKRSKRKKHRTADDVDDAGDDPLPVLLDGLDADRQELIDRDMRLHLPSDSMRTVVGTTVGATGVSETALAGAEMETSKERARFRGGGSTVPSAAQRSRMRRVRGLTPEEAAEAARKAAEAAGTDPSAVSLLAPAGATVGGSSTVEERKAGCILTLRGHEATVWSVTANERIIVTGSADCTVRIWRAADGKFLRMLRGHDGAVRAVDLDPERPFFASGSSDTGLRLWVYEGSSTNPARSVRCRFMYRGHESGITVVRVLDAQVVSGAMDGTVIVWDPERSRPQRIIKAHKSAITCLQADTARVVTAARDNNVKVFDAVTGANLQTILGAHNDPVIALQYDNIHLITVASDRTLRIWPWHDSMAPAGAVGGDSTGIVREHIFQPHERPAAVARRYRCTLKQLMTWNNIHSLREFYAGRRLFTAPPRVDDKEAIDKEQKRGEELASKRENTGKSKAKAAEARRKKKERRDKKKKRRSGPRRRMGIAADDDDEDDDDEDYSDDDDEEDDKETDQKGPKTSMDTVNEEDEGPEDSDEEYNPPEAPKHPPPAKGTAVASIVPHRGRFGGDRLRDDFKSGSAARRLAARRLKPLSPETQANMEAHLQDLQSQADDPLDAATELLAYARIKAQIGHRPLNAPRPIGDPEKMYGPGQDPPSPDRPDEEDDDDDLSLDSDEDEVRKLFGNS